MNLQALYEQPEYTRFLHSRYYVEGLITGACACPEIPLPDTWLPWTIASNPQSAEAAMTAAQTEFIFEQLFSFFKAVLADMKNKQLSIPAYAVYKTRDSSHELSQYCAGLMAAHQSCEKLWQQAWQHMQTQKSESAPALAKDLKHCLLVFSTFADPELAIEQAKARGELGLEQKLPLIAQSLQATLQQYVELSGKLAAFLPNQFETFEQQAD